MKTLRQVRNTLSKIEFINSGGCGFSTLFMYLAAKNPLRYSIFSGHSRFGSSLDGIQVGSNIRACPHVFLYDSDKREFFDCDGVVDIFNYDVLERIDLHKLVSIIKGPGWNNMFDRNNVPKIEKKTGISLEAFDFECCRPENIY